MVTPEEKARIKRTAAALVAFEAATRRWVVYEHPMHRGQWCVEDRPRITDYGPEGTVPIDGIALRTFNTKEEALEFKRWECIQAVVDAIDKYDREKGDVDRSMA